MKTQNEILTDIYKIIKASPIDALNGGIYKKTRPTASNLEDCIISLISGVKGKFLQDAALFIKIFYNDIKLNNSYFEDELNGQSKEQLLIDLSTTLLKTEGYSFLVETRETYTEKVLDDDINQHFAVLKINFLLT
jgi:hypothetical protein